MGKKSSRKRRDRPESEPSEVSFDPNRLLVDLRDAKKSIEDGQRNVEHLVRTARAAGLTWPQVGGALGVTTQAAQQRYGRAPKL
jgi:hypothetical protein